MFGVALYFILKAYYEEPNNTGLPNPRVLTAPVYLYAILALASDFLEGLPVVIGAGLTVALIWQAQSRSQAATKPTTKKVA